MKKYRIRFRILNTNNPTQEVIVEATSTGAAKAIWQQSHPNCELSSITEVH